MIHIIISAYGEPLSTERAVNAFLSQNIKEKFKIIVMDPFPDVKEYLLKKFKHVKEFQFFEDPGEGKSFALNEIFQEIYSNNKNDLIISTDGDVYVGSNSLKEIRKYFKNNELGVACGKVVSTNDPDTMTGYWSHISFNEMNNLRKKLSEKKEFFELSGYLLAFINGVIKELPLESAEDKVIPSLFYSKGYKVGFVENAEVYILNPQNLKDWIIQKRRNIKGQINLKKAISKNTKFSLFGEIPHAFNFIIKYSRGFKRFFWVQFLLFFRLYAWFLAYYDIKFKKKKYSDGWRGESQTLSTSPLD